MLGSQDTGTGQSAGGAETRLGFAVIWCQTSVRLAAAGALLSFVSFSSFRVYTLLAILLLVLVVMVTIRNTFWSTSTGAHVWYSTLTRWELIDPSQNNQSGTGPQLSDGLKRFLHETSTFKQQHPGKFCLLVCSLCTFFAVLGRYISGIVISYILVLAVFLWPLISSHEIGLWVDPVLQKLDFGIGEFVQKIKDNHKKRLLQQAEKEGIESDLSSMFPKLDSTVCKEMSISDTEASDLTWTDNGTFSLSEGHTPQTENSDDLDKEEVFAGGLPEFPSLDNGSLTNGEDDDDFSLGLLSPSAHLQHPLACKHQSSDKAVELINQMASNAIAAAVTAAVQERIEAAAGFTGQSAHPECTSLSPLDLTAESDSEVEDFELLDQSELDHLEEKLELGEQVKSDTESSAGFFYKILKRR